MRLTIGETVKVLRNRKQWNQKYLAKKAGVSVYAISMIENDNPEMRIGNVAKAMLALDYALEITLGNNKQPETQKDNDENSTPDTQEEMV